MPTLKRAFLAFWLVLSILSTSTVLHAATNVVRIREVGVLFLFDPTNLTINPGDTVKWTNTVVNQHDSRHKNTNGQATLWASPELSSTATPNTFSFTFTNLGSYPYFCFRHAVSNPNQTGTVVVVTPNLPPLVSLTNPTNGALFFAPASFTLMANASDSDGSVTQVEFFRASTSLGVSTTNPYSNNVIALAAGNYVFTAAATDNLGAKSTSAVVNVKVTAPPTITLNTVQRMPDGTFQFMVTGGSFGQTCIIDACDVLPNWSPVFTNVFPNTTCPICPFIPFSTPPPGLQQRFYRSRVFP